ncbi:Antiviral helicase SKI2 [Bienertia sinuspersici]
MEGSVTLRFWHGGVLKRTNRGLQYVGGQAKNYAVDPDELCWFFLKQLAEKCGPYNDVHEILYLTPHCSMDDGLKRIYNDKEVLEMGAIVVENRSIDLFTIHGKDPQNQPKNQPENPEYNNSKQIPDEEYYKWYDDRPDSPIPLNVLISGSEDSEDSDPLYEPDRGEEIVTEESLGSDAGLQDDFEDAGLEEEFEVEIDVEDDVNVLVEEGDSSDDELKEARERQKKTNAQLIELAQQVQKDAVATAAGQGTNVPSTSEVNKDGYVSEYADSDDEELTPNEDGDEEGTISKKRAKKLVVHEGTDWNTFEWKVGQRFPNRKSFKEAVTKYAVYQGRNLSFVGSNKNRQQRFEVKCLPGCAFRLYASWDSGRDCFLLKSVDTGHCCSRNMEKNKQLKSPWLAQQFLEIFKARPHWPAKDIIETVKRAYRVLISRDVAYKVKYHAHKLLHGSMKDHYLKVGRYLKFMKQNSPDTKLVLVTDQESRPEVFKRLFVCFDGVAKGWIEGCRKVLCVDACFLKTFLGGQLLAAIGRDGNDQMYPVAWAVVEGENNQSWEWFINKVKQSLQLNDGAGMAIISDEHQSILSAVAKLLPEAEHRHCARHIYAHWAKSFRGDEFKQLFWRAAKAYNEADYNDALQEMEQVNSASVDAFKRYNPRLFCRAFMNTDTKVDVIVNNLAETFNGYIVSARTKHLLYMLEDIRTALMQRLAVKKKEMQRSVSIICPRIEEKLEKAKKDAAECNVVPSSATVFQVSHKMDILSVDLEARSCTCRRWDLTGIPCCHAVSSIFFCHRNAEDYVAHWYTKDTYARSYTVSIPPCVGDRHWPKVDLPLNPPPIKIGPGRPRKNRIKDPFENPKKPEQVSRGVIEPAQTTGVLNATAQPTRLGRGGRVIRGGRGSRGGSTSGGGRGGINSRTGRGRGTGRESTSGVEVATVTGRGRTRGRGRGPKGRGGQFPEGIGLIVANDGASYFNSIGMESPVQLTPSSTTSVRCEVGTQSSAAAT